MAEILQHSVFISHGFVFVLFCCLCVIFVLFLWVFRFVSVGFIICPLLVQRAELILTMTLTQHHDPNLHLYIAGPRNNRGRQALRPGLPTLHEQNALHSQSCKYWTTVRKGISKQHSLEESYRTGQKRLVTKTTDSWSS